FTMVNSGAPFTLVCSLVYPSGAGQTSSYTAAAGVPASQTATIAGTVKPNDVLVTTVNGTALTYTAAATDTDPTSLAKSNATMINASTVTDPVTTLPMNGVVAAASSGGVITLTAKDPTTSFTLTCQRTVGTETYTAAGPFPASQTATVANTFAAGRVLTTTVN